MSTTYTEEELKASITDAVAPFEARIRELEASHEQATMDAKLAEIKEPLEAQVVELQTQLDAAVLETEAAKTEYAALVSYLEGLKAEEEALKEFAALRDERLARVRETAAFPETHLEANADRWTRMDDEAFESALADWKLISSKSPQELANVPVETAMSGATNDKSVTDGKGLLREMFDMTIRGIDPRKV